MQVDLSKYKKIIDNLRKLEFYNFHQAGSINQYHELNLIIENPIQDRQYWITKSFGKFDVIYREGINNSKAQQYRFPCKSQKEVCEVFTKLTTQ